MSLNQRFFSACETGNVILFNTLLSQGVKDRISTVVGVAKTAFHWGFMPTVLYLGFQKGAEPGMPELNLASLLWA